MQQDQVAVARKLNIGQDTISRYERQADLLLSTLQGYVEAVEGKLSLLVEFPDRKPIKIACCARIRRSLPCLDVAELAERGINASAQGTVSQRFFQ